MKTGTVSLGEANYRFEVNQRAAEFARLTAFMLCGQDEYDAAQLADVTKAATDRIRTILKTAIAAGSLTDSGFASQLAPYANLAAGFIDSLAGISVFDTMLSGGMRRIPPRTRTVVMTGTTGSTVAEGTAKPVLQFASTGSETQPTKAVALIVVSEELARFATTGSIQLLNAELRKAVTAATDAAFLATLTSGISSVISAGTTANDVLTDLRSLLSGIDIHADSRLFWIVDTDAGKNIATMPTDDDALAFPDMTPTGGEIQGITVLVSENITPGTAILVDASGIGGDDEALTLDVASKTSLQMDSVPTQSGATGTGSAMVSLFQTDLRALRATRYFVNKRLRDSAVARLSGVGYGTASGT